MFRESRPGHYIINLKVVGAYLLVAILHGLWDGVPAVLESLTGAPIAVFIGKAVVGLTGLIILWLRWREARRLQEQRLVNTGPAQPQ